VSYRYGVEGSRVPGAKKGLLGDIRVESQNVLWYQKALKSKLLKGYTRSHKYTRCIDDDKSV
jgi:hypothetical protein